MANQLLARSAEDTFWLARHVERAENLARILDVNATFSRDIRGARDWMPVVQLNADEERFFERHAVASAETVLSFYIIDRTNPTSIVSTVSAARANARALRPLISREMWSQLNVFYNWVGSLDEAALSPSHLARLLNDIKHGCQTHTGITDGTFHRDQGWYFYWLGRYLERADQTTRLLDIKYHLLLPDKADIGSPFDMGQWNALLRSAAAYHPYRRIQAGGVTPAGVADFLLFDPNFPRSVSLCANEADRLLGELCSRHGVSGGSEVGSEVAALRRMLRDVTVSEVLRQGLHEFLDLIQRRLIAVTHELSGAFFGRGPVSKRGPAFAVGASQGQSTSA